MTGTLWVIPSYATEHRPCKEIGITTVSEHYYLSRWLEKYDEITLKMDPSGAVVSSSRDGKIVRTEIHPQNILKLITILYANTDEEWDNS